MAEQEVYKFTLEEVGFLLMRADADDAARVRGAYRQGGVLIYKDSDEAIEEMKALANLLDDQKTSRKLTYRTEARVLATKRLETIFSAETTGNTLQLEHINDPELNKALGVQKVEDREIQNPPK